MSHHVTLCHITSHPPSPLHPLQPLPSPSSPLNPSLPPLQSKPISHLLYRTASPWEPLPYTLSILIIKSNKMLVVAACTLKLTNLLFSLNSSSFCYFSHFWAMFALGIPWYTPYLLSSPLHELPEGTGI